MLMKNLTCDEAEMLVMKGVIRKGSGLIIRGLSKNDSDEYMVSKIGRTKDNVIFYVYNSYKECQYKIKQSAIFPCIIGETVKVVIFRERKQFYAGIIVYTKIIVAKVCERLNYS